MSKKGHVPDRMCLGCRKRRKNEEMIRFTEISAGVLMMDEKKNRNGRGYYLCPDRNCLKLAQKKSRWLASLGSMDRGDPVVKGSLSLMKDLT